MRYPAIVLVLFSAALGVSPARGQERRVAVPVDYLAGADVYVALGSRDGLVQGDSIPAYLGEAGERRGVFLARVVTLRRAVLAFAGPRFPLAVGDTLWLGVPRPPVPEAPAGQPPGAQPQPGAGAAGQPLGAAAARVRSPRLDGRISLDLDAVRTDAFEGGTRSYTIPTLRLYAVASELPGGVRASTNVRASRLARLGLLDPVSAVHVYDASFEKTFTTVPLRLQAGRFSAPLQAYGGYWDGMLARVGGSRFGIGGAAGWLPGRADEGFSTDVPRASAFADYHAAGGAVRYDAEVGVHALRPRAGFADQTFAALTQRLRWQGVWLSQSVQVDRGGDARWAVSALQLSASVPLRPGLSARISGSRHRRVELGGLAPLPTYDRDRGSLGLSWFTPAVSAWTDFSLARRPGARATRSYSAALQFPRVIAGFGVGANASRSEAELFTSTYLAGELTRRIGRALARAGYRATTYEGMPTVRHARGADLTLDFPLIGRTAALLRLETWWGDAAGPRDRILTSISTGF